MSEQTHTKINDLIKKIREQQATKPTTNEEIKPKITEETRDKFREMLKSKKAPYDTNEYKKLMWLIETKEPFASIAKEVLADSKNDKYPHDSFHVKVINTIIDNYDIVKK